MVTMSWNEVLERDLAAMRAVVAEIEATGDESRKLKLEAKLAVLNIHYIEHRRAAENGESCNYVPQFYNF